MEQASKLVRPQSRLGLATLVDEARQYVAGRERCYSVFGERHVPLGVIVSQLRYTVFSDSLLTAVWHRLNVTQYRYAIASFYFLPAHVRFPLIKFPLDNNEGSQRTRALIWVKEIGEKLALKRDPCRISDEFFSISQDSISVGR